MRARTQRLWTLLIAGMLLVGAAILVAVAMSRTADMFYTPTAIAETGGPTVGQRAKVGGFVAPGSLRYAQGAEILFTVVDESPHSIEVSYRGVTPDLFQEGSGVVATGAFDDGGLFVATQLLAKHDENYVPRELKDIEAPST